MYTSSFLCKVNVVQECPVTYTEIPLHAYEANQVQLETHCRHFSCNKTHAGMSDCSCRWSCRHCCPSNAAGGRDREGRTAFPSLGSRGAYAWQWGSRKTPPGHRWNDRGRGVSRRGSGTQETAAESSPSCHLGGRSGKGVGRVKPKKYNEV